MRAQYPTLPDPRERFEKFWEQFSAAKQEIEKLDETCSTQTLLSAIGGVNEGKRPHLKFFAYQVALDLGHFSPTWHRAVSQLMFIGEGALPALDSLFPGQLADMDDYHRRLEVLHERTRFHFRRLVGESWSKHDLEFALCEWRKYEAGEAEKHWTSATCGTETTVLAPELVRDRCFPPPYMRRTRLAKRRCQSTCHGQRPRRAQEIFLL